MQPRRAVCEPQMVPTWDQVRRKLEEDAKSPPHETLGKEFQGRDDIEIGPLSADELDR